MTIQIYKNPWLEWSIKFKNINAYKLGFWKHEHKRNCYSQHPAYYGLNLPFFTIRCF